MNLQLAENQHRVSTALCAAESGLEIGKYLISSYTPVVSGDEDVVSTDHANQTWQALWAHFKNKLEEAPELLNGQVIDNIRYFTDAYDSGQEFIVPEINFGSPDTGFQLRLYRYDSDPLTVKMQVVGARGQVERSIGIDLSIQKNSDVLKYSVAGRGRMWLTGDSIIYGDVFSSWDRPEIPPFSLSAESRVHGTINTVLSREQIAAEGYQLETLDENGNPIFDLESPPSIEPLLDEYGEPIYDQFNYRVYSAEDVIQGYHRNINYDQPGDTHMPGMDIADYDTDGYNSGLTTIPECPSPNRVTEYFPHAAGDYTTPSSYSSRQLNRHVYENVTFNNAYLPDDRNALFKNCTFENVLYVDCAKSGYTYNNVRFDNCTFNGTIVTDTPQTLLWKNNALYFTGEATFDNTSDMQEATILAPHFNVDLGNTNPEASDNNILTGAIVGGIVDVRGNAQIFGTIISMCDTTQWSSGYVTNIGATLEDGGSETTDPGDVGVIEITPAADKLLPSGIMSPIVVRELEGSYYEIF